MNESKNALVVKDNALINASYNLEVVEQRLILLAILKARETAQEIKADTILSIHASDYVNHFNVTKEAAYNAMKSAVSNLFERQFSFQPTSIPCKDFPQFKVHKVRTKSRWVSQITYIDEIAVVQLIFAPSVVPLVTQLERQFTSYQLKQVSQLNSKYSIRLYELLISWREVGKTPQLDLGSFREKIGIGQDEYVVMSDFKKRVLEPAIKQINQYTDITVAYEQHKQGRTIIGFSFKFKQKPQPKKEVIRDPNTLDMFCNLSDKQISYYSNIMSKLHSISDLAGNKDYPAFAVWIANILRDPAGVREETAKRIFKALRTETDFKD